MVKRVFATQITSVIARGKLLAEIRKVEEAGYATNPLLRADIKRAEKRIAQDNIEDFVEVTMDDEKIKYCLHGWFVYGEQYFKDNAKFYRTKKLNRAHSYISSGVLKDGREFKVTRL